MNVYNASYIGYVSALSGVGAAAAGSTNASNFGKFTHGTLLFIAGSVNNLTLNVMRATASSGTFASFGASINATAGSGKIYARTFTIGSSNWHKLSYDNNGAGSVIGPALFVLHGSRDFPIYNQPHGGQITILSDVTN